VADIMPLRAEVLYKSYGQKPAVTGVSFEVAAGEIVGLLGPNGAGKTTTISMILGVLKPTAGRVLIAGHDVARTRAKALAAANFAAVYAPLPGNLTVEENLRFFGRIYGVSPLALRVEEVMTDYDLMRFRHTRCGVLSSGEQTRVALAKAMLNRPQLLVLDEPTASLDPSTAREIRERIQRFAKQENGGVLWTSHNMAEVEAVCDRVLFMASGRILLQGDPKTLATQHGYATLEDLFVAVARTPLNAEAA